MVSVVEFSKAQRAKGPATIIAIGTANPPNCVLQSTYPEYYFRVTKSEHMEEMKQKFERICEKSMIRKRHMYLTEDILKEKPNLSEYLAPSFDDTQSILVAEIPKLGQEAATRAIEEWGQPKSKITHLIFCTTSGAELPGADYQLIKLLGLDKSVKRFMMYHIGCYAGGMALRLAKDLAENNKDARVLVVSCELTVITFRGPDDIHVDNLVSQSLFGDGAAALIVGSDPLPNVENKLFEIVSASQTIVPGSEGAIEGHLHEIGLIIQLLPTVPMLVSEHIKTSLVEAFQPLGISDWNSLFWIVHPGGARILDQIEEKLCLKPDKLGASRHVLSEYGNMGSASVLFVLDEMRRSSAKLGLGTTGQGLEWGVLFGFGPGLTIETLVLHSVPN